MRTPLAVILLATATAACTSSTGPHARDVRLLGALDPDGRSIRCTLVNLGADTLFAAGCCARAAFYVERRFGLFWENVAGGICLAICSPTPQPVAPGGSISGASTFSGPGTYRVRVQVSASRSDRDPGWISSPTFTIR